MVERVLIVDDEARIRRVVGRVLENAGYAYLEASSGEEALGIADKSADISLLLTDLKMDGMDGLQLARQFLEIYPDCPVLMMTAYADLESARSAIAIGIYEYFLKPFDVGDLMAAVQRALTHRRLVLENRAYQRDLEVKVAERTQQLTFKIRELEARDRLLRHLLALEEPAETLDTALRIVMDLVECDCGNLYVRDQSGKIVLAASRGQHPPPTLDSVVDEQSLIPPGSSMDEPRLPANEGWGKLEAECSTILPVEGPSEAAGYLEVWRLAASPRLTDDELDLLGKFVPYVALAIKDCQIAEEICIWEEDADRMIENVHTWGAQTGDSGVGDARTDNRKD